MIAMLNNLANLSKAATIALGIGGGVALLGGGIAVGSAMGKKSEQKKAAAANQP
jgi:hypothetical protein